jgi:hypothetical protein
LKTCSEVIDLEVTKKDENESISNEDREYNNVKILRAKAIVGIFK